MSTSLNVSSFRITAPWSYSNSNPSGTGSFSGSFAYNQAFTNGTGAGKVDEIWVGMIDIAAAGNYSLDLSSTVKDLFNRNISFAKVKWIYIELVTEDANGDVTINGNFFSNVLLGNAGAAFLLKPGGVFTVCDPGANGWTVTAGTGDTITLTNGAGGTVTLNIIVAGEAPGA
jgi:hypothetical protein